jgi:acetolactate synthase-1/2/3 large subunit
VPIVGDCRLVIEELVKAVRAEKNKREFPALDAWHTQLREWQERYPLRYEQLEDGPLKPQFCIDMLRDNTPDDTIVASGVGQHQMWTSQRWKFNHPYTFVNSGRPRHDGLRGAGGHRRQGRQARAHGVGGRRRRLLPDDRAGARHRERGAHPGEDRDPQQRVPRHGAQWQELFYEERYSEVYLSPDLPDYVKWAEAMGCVGVPRRHARRRRAHDREGERDRRPSRW